VIYGLRISGSTFIIPIKLPIVRRETDFASIWKNFLRKSWIYFNLSVEWSERLQSVTFMDIHWVFKKNQKKFYPVKSFNLYNIRRE